MTAQIPQLQVTPLFRCHIFYDCHPKAGEYGFDDFPTWQRLNDLVYCAAVNADTTDHETDVNTFDGGAACFPYIEITAPTWAVCKAMGDAVIRCILDNGGIVEPKDNGINI